MMSKYKKLSHTIYYCVYHIVFCPKYRYRIMDKTIVDYCKQHIYHLCSQKELVEVKELNIQPDHIHMVLSIPPKHAVSHIMGFLKGKLALKLFGKYEKLNKRYWGLHFWSRGYCVSTVGLNEDQIRKYMKWQQKKITIPKINNSIYYKTIAPFRANIIKPPPLAVVINFKLFDHAFNV